jgi:hypothetical protein
MAKLTSFFLLKYANYARIFILIIEKNFDPKIRINPWTDPGLIYYMPFRIDENYIPIRILDRHPGMWICGFDPETLLFSCLGIGINLILLKIRQIK